MKKGKQKNLIQDNNNNNKNKEDNNIYINSKEKFNKRQIILYKTLDFFCSDLLSIIQDYFRIHYTDVFPRCLTLDLTLPRKIKTWNSEEINAFYLSFLPELKDYHVKYILNFMENKDQKNYHCLTFLTQLANDQGCSWQNYFFISSQIWSTLFSIYTIEKSLLIYGVYSILACHYYEPYSIRIILESFLSTYFWLLIFSHSSCSSSSSSKKIISTKLFLTLFNLNPKNNSLPLLLGYNFMNYNTFLFYLSDMIDLPLSFLIRFFLPSLLCNKEINFNFTTFLNSKINNYDNESWLEIIKRKFKIGFYQTTDNFFPFLEFKKIILELTEDEFSQIQIKAKEIYYQATCIFQKEFFKFIR